jgi:hypothetical protein
MNTVPNGAVFFCLTLIVSDITKFTFVITTAN